MFYADKTMPIGGRHFPLPPFRSFVLLGGWGALVGVFLSILGAPFWAFYVAPVSMAPLLIHELRALDAGKRTKMRRASGKRPLAD